jgi:hypothetical protein
MLYCLGYMKDGQMVIAYLLLGILTGLVSATAILFAGHSMPMAILAYALAGSLTMLLAAFKVAQTYEQDHDIL